VELVAFDLDGTLVDSAPDLSHCLGTALGAVGLPAPTETQTRGWVGGGIELLLKRALVHSTDPDTAEALHPAALAAFTACYERNLFVRSRLYDGVERTLTALGERGLPLHCITNKRLAFAEALLEQAGIRARFALVLGGDSLPEKKPRVAPLGARGARGGTPRARASRRRLEPGSPRGARGGLQVRVGDVRLLQGARRRRRAARPSSRAAGRAFAAPGRVKAISAQSRVMRSVALLLLCSLCTVAAHAALPPEIERVLAGHSIPADAVSIVVQPVDS